MDPLSDVLRAVRLNGAYFYRVEAASPWSYFTAGARELVPRVMPGAEHLISYHILLTGGCWAGVAGEQQIHLCPGDVVVFPHGDPHLMSSDQGRGAGAPRQGGTPLQFPGNVFLGDGTDRDTSFVCGFLGCDSRPFNPLLAALPRRLHMPGAAAGWLAEFPRKVVAESRTRAIGSETMLTRMAELMFIEVLRNHLSNLPDEQTGWLAALRDAVVGPALLRMHERPAHPWTLPELAQGIASSRTVLADRFTKLVGMPPMRYLTRWRLQLAAELLASGSIKVSSIATTVGYDSEAAFSRAFKRETDMSPALWRRERQRDAFGG